MLLLLLLRLLDLLLLKLPHSLLYFQQLTLQCIHALLCCFLLHACLLSRLHTCRHHMLSCCRECQHPDARLLQLLVCGLLQLHLVACKGVTTGKLQTTHADHFG
jgi:hypothetical protein